MKILGKRWQIDLHAQHEAHLQLSAVDLPGSVQKKKTVEDELQMRERFKEGDLISVSLPITYMFSNYLALHLFVFCSGKCLMLLGSGHCMSSRILFFIIATPLKFENACRPKCNQ